MKPKLTITEYEKFTLACGTRETVAACDYVGIVSGRDVPDKVAKAGFTTVKSKFVNAPIINELPVTLECELYRILDDGMYIGRIVNVSADEKFLGADGEPDLALFTPVTFDPVHNKYVALGEAVGEAFCDGEALK